MHDGLTDEVKFEMRKALLLTMAAYEDTEDKAIAYLRSNRVKEHHDFKNLIPAKMPHEDQSREITYIVAEDSTDNIFISFHGTTRLRDFETFNFKIKQICNRTKDEHGFHEGFWDFAKLFPFTTVFNKEW